MTKTLLPLVLGPTPPRENPEQGTEREGIEKLLFERMVNAPDQGRETLTIDSRLKAAACRRVRSMAEGEWTGHVDPFGHGPDWYVRAEGYVLPPWYWVDKEGARDRSNHVESLHYGGNPDESDAVKAEVIWNGLMNHEPHRIHILGLETFSTQTHIGICVWFDRSAPSVWYVSIISAPPSLE